MLLFALGFIRIQMHQPQLQSFLRLLHQELANCHAVRRREIRQLGLTQLQRQVATLGDLDRILQRCRHIGEQCRHFGLGLERLLIVETAHAPCIGQHLAFSDTGTHFMRNEFFLVQKLDRVRRHHRHTGLGRQCHSLLHMRLYIWLVGTLDLDIEIIRKNRGPALQAAFRRLKITVVDGHADIAEMGAGQRNQTVAVGVTLQLRQPFSANFRATAMQVLQPGARQQFAQLQIAVTILDQQQQARRLVAIVVVADPDIAADDRFDAFAARSLVELDHAEQIGQVGNAKRCLAILGSGFDYVIDANQAIDDGILGVQAEVDKLRCRHGRYFTLPPRLPSAKLGNPVSRVYNIDKSTTYRETSHAVPHFLRQYCRL